MTDNIDNNKKHELEYKKRLATMEPEEKDLFEKLMTFNKMLDVVLERLSEPEPNVQDVIRDFDPISIKIALDQADGYLSLIDLRHEIEQKGLSMMGLLGMMDVSNAEHPEMIKKTAEEGVAPGVTDYNHVERDIIEMNLALFLGDRAEGDT